VAELVNLRIVRKRKQRGEADSRAASNRLAHGQPKSQRKLETAQREKAKRDLDQRRINKGDDR
jgi:hypothetical protein